MPNVEFDDRTIHIDALVLALELGIAVSTLQGLMRSGKITSLCERGVDSDVGRHRLTFFHQNRRLRLIVDDAGNIIRRSTIDLVIARCSPRCTGPTHETGFDIFDAFITRNWRLQNL